MEDSHTTWNGTWVLKCLIKALLRWAVNSFGLGLMALLSEWMCIKKELQEIPLSTFRYRNSTPLQQNTRLQQITAITG